MSFSCGIDEPTPELPDTGGTCCMGAILDGPQRCTCWRTIYTDGQQDPGALDTPPAARTTMCGDCAYRPGSPEKQSDPDYRGDATELERLAATSTPFYCHDGMRSVLRWEHPTGAILHAPDGAYAPPINGTVPLKTDGTAANLCAGWDARRRALQAAQLCLCQPINRICDMRRAQGLGMWGKGPSIVDVQLPESDLTQGGIDP